MSDVIEELRWRGLLQDLSEGSAAHLAAEPRVVYAGFDPTATSLHVGSLVPIMGLMHFQRHGHAPIAVVGGGTGLIGDPSGKSEERQLLTEDVVRANAEGIHRQLEHFLDFGTAKNPARMRNNLDWLGRVSLVEFLRDTGKHFRVNDMLRKESVKSRLEKEETGLSYTEFSYLLLQSYDFLRLFQEDGCTVQIGGSDQWGNITAGTDLIRRVTGKQAFGLTLPLVTTASGVKFGKTESGAVWLDAARTSPFRFYQYWLNTTDADVIRYVKFFTLMGRDEVAELEASVQSDPGARTAQKALADDVTRRVHGEDGLARARQATAALFGGELGGLSADEIADIFADVSSSEVTRAQLDGDGMTVVELFAGTPLAQSRSAARREIEGGGIYVNGHRVDHHEVRVTIEHAVEGRFLVLRKGKKTYHLARVSG